MFLLLCVLNLELKTSYTLPLPSWWWVASVEAKSPLIKRRFCWTVVFGCNHWRPLCGRVKNRMTFEKSCRIIKSIILTDQRWNETGFNQNKIDWLFAHRRKIPNPNLEDARIKSTEFCMFITNTLEILPQNKASCLLWVDKLCNAISNLLCFIINSHYRHSTPE